VLAISRLPWPLTYNRTRSFGPASSRKAAIDARMSVAVGSTTTATESKLPIAG